MDRVLITGISGLLGSNLAYASRDRFEVVGAYHLNPVSANWCDTIPLDLRQADEVWSTVHRLKPRIVIHCAAETRVDYCEEQPQEAIRVNAEGTGSLARAAAHLGSKFVYISTDSVFDGNHGRYGEDADTGPVNAYSRSKLMGEQSTQSCAENHLIVRTNIYGWNSRSKLSLAEWVLDRLENDDFVPGFADVYFSPILVNDLADVLLQMMITGLNGVYNVAAEDSCSKLDFATMICQEFEQDPNLVRSAISEDAGLKARRPKDTTLDVTKVTQALGQAMPTVLQGLHRFRLLRENGFVDKLRSISTQAKVSR